MAKQIIQKLIDDLDGGDASETVPFAYDGVEYTIDLNDTNAEALRKALAPYLDAGTRQGRANGTWRTVSRSQPQRSNRADNQAIREWANNNGYPLSGRGRIPHSVVQAYEEAKNAPAAPPKPAKVAKPQKIGPVKATKRAPRKKAVPAVRFAAS